MALTPKEMASAVHGFANLTHVSAAIRGAVVEIGELIGEMVRR